MNVITNWHLSMKVDDILHGQGVDPGVVIKSKPSLRMVAERALTDGFSRLHPVASTRELFVNSHSHDCVTLVGGATLTGPLVTRQLAGAQRVIVAVCTIGTEIEDAVTHLLYEDPLYALALEGLGNAAVEHLSQQVCAQIGEQAQVEGLQASTPLSPGSSDWPVEIGQPEIFNLLDPSKIGIALTSGGMMVPKKSMSFIIGIGPEMSQTNMCEVCDLKETCRYGHA
jgi:hypothetical protein